MGRDLPHIDRSHLILCSVARQAVADAGLEDASLRDQRVGVYVAHSEGDCSAGDTDCHVSADWLADRMRDLTAAANLAPEEILRLQQKLADGIRARFRRSVPQSGHRLGPQYAAGIIRESLGLVGPAMIVDTACASSLTALTIAAHVAVGTHRHGDRRIGQLFSFRPDAASGAGRGVIGAGQPPFSADSDGISLGEGYAALVLRGASAVAERSDRVRGLIVGIGASSNGRGRGVWKPVAEAQVLAILPAYGEELSAAHIQFVEAHATSTALGDAIEVEALNTALFPHGAGNERLPIGSSKGNIGHTLETAGLAGLIKTLLSMNRGVIPPTVGSTEALNDKVDWTKTSLFVPRAPLAWDPPTEGRPRCAALTPLASVARTSTC